MAPPPKGTRKYVAYLKKQKERRRVQRTTEKKQRKLQQAAPYMRRVVRQLLNEQKTLKEKLMKVHLQN